MYHFSSARKFLIFFSMPYTIFSLGVQEQHAAAFDFLMSQDGVQQLRESNLRESGDAAILGQISFSGPGTLEDVSIQLYTTEGSLIKEAYVDALGYYQFSCLPQGEYLVKASNISSENFCDRWYGEGYRLDEATIIETDGVTPSTGFNIELEIGGIISGSFTASGTAPGLLSLYDAVSEEVVTSAEVNPGESYEFSKLYSGSYKLRGTSYSYQNAWYLDGSTFENATDINVIQGQETSDITLNLLTSNTSPLISGDVIFQNGQPALNTYVFAYKNEWPIDVNGTFSSMGIVDASGAYSITNLDDGEYFVIATTYTDGFRSEIYNNVGFADEATTVLIQNQTPIFGIDFSLDTLGATISGMVPFSQETGTVGFFGTTPYDLDDLMSWYINLLVRQNSASIGSDGYYINRTFWPGDYLVSTSAPDNAGTIYYPGTFNQLSAEWVTVSSTDSLVENINFNDIISNPEPTGTVTGNLTLSHHPESEESISLAFFDAYDETSILAGTTSQLGEYSIEIPVGEYKLMASYAGILSYPNVHWYENSPDFESGTILHITEGTTIENINISFDQCVIYDPLGIQSNLAELTSFVLNQNYPNPFNPSTTIRYGLPETSDVSISIYDIRGREVISWQESNQTAGWYDLQWSGLTRSGVQAPAGMYFTRLVADEYSSVVKMVYLR